MEILIIDNDPSALEALAHRLRSRYPSGRLHSFTDPLLAVKYGYNHLVDLLCARTDMRGLSGDEAARLLRTVHPALRVELLAAGTL